MPKRKKSPREPDTSSWGGMGGAAYVKGQTLPDVWSPEVYARWFFDFLRTDLATLTPGQLLGMRADLWAFVRPEIILNKTWGDEYLPSLEVLAALQCDARDGIQAVREDRSYDFKEGIGGGIVRRGDKIIRRRQRGTFEDLFRDAVMETVQMFWDRLHECPRCHRIFVKVGKQKYCSPTCASRTHWERFKARRSARDHHREYTGRVRKRLGSNVKVTTKPRRRT